MQTARKSRSAARSGRSWPVASCSIAKSPIYLDRNLSRFVVVRSSERIAHVEQVTLVEDIQGGELEGPVVPACSSGQVDRRVAGKVARAVAIEEARTVAEI